MSPAIEDFHAILVSISDPDVAVAVNRDSLRAREICGPVPGSAERTEESAVGIEDLDPSVQSVADYLKLSRS